jgi:hypothetical protein
LAVYAKDATTAKGSIFLPGETEAHELTINKEGGNFKMNADPSAGRVTWNIRLNSDN